MAEHPPARRPTRLRAFRSDDVEVQMVERMAQLSLLKAGPGELRRALREARKAARAGAGHYDPLRHAALVRLLAPTDARGGGRQAHPRREADAEPGGPAPCPRAHRPSNRAVDR